MRSDEVSGGGGAGHFFDDVIYGSPLGGPKIRNPSPLGGIRIHAHPNFSQIFKNMTKSVFYIFLRFSTFFR